MITNPKEQKICDRYSAYDNTGHVHCNECPLRKNDKGYDFRCKANSHYNRKTKEWEYDYWEKGGMNMTIGKRIEIIRKENGLTVDEFASTLKVTSQTVRFWEQDKILIRLIDAAEICKIFRVQMDWLAGFSGGIQKED